MDQEPRTGGQGLVSPAEQGNQIEFAWVVWFPICLIEARFVCWKYATMHLYRVIINERHNVLHYCDPILSPGDFLSLLGGY